METEIKCIEKDCDNTFLIEEGEAKFYTDKNMCLPKRCKDCRIKRRNEREEK